MVPRNNKSRGQTLATIEFDLRDDVFCHGQLPVRGIEQNRSKEKRTVPAVVRPERLINGVPHVANFFFGPFIYTATGEDIPTISAFFYRPPNDVSSQQLISAVVNVLG